MDEKLEKYREYLLDVERQLKDKYEKLVVALAGGSLGLSITFLKDIVGDTEPVCAWTLLIAWAMFVISIGCTLGAIYFGMEAYRKAILQVDDGSIREQKAGGKFARITKLLHKIAAIALILGLVLISIFAFLNL